MKYNKRVIRWVKKMYKKNPIGVINRIHTDFKGICYAGTMGKRCPNFIYNDDDDCTKCPFFTKKNHDIALKQLEYGKHIDLGEVIK